jgi:hypothetical protein
MGLVPEQIGRGDGWEVPEMEQVDATVAGVGGCEENAGGGRGGEEEWGSCLMGGVDEMCEQLFDRWHLSSLILCDTDPLP